MLTAIHLQQLLTNYRAVIRRTTLALGQAEAESVKPCVVEVAKEHRRVAELFSQQVLTATDLTRAIPPELLETLFYAWKLMLTEHELITTNSEAPPLASILERCRQEAIITATLAQEGVISCHNPFDYSPELA